MASLPHACVGPEIWAVQVASRACLPDKRLDKRLADILATFAAKPLDSIPQAFGSATAAKATYDFFKNKRFDSNDLLLPLVEITAESCRGVSKILAVQDTTSLNYTTLRHTKGLGPLNDSETAQGLHLHTTIALRTDGVPIGLLHQQCWSRPAEKRSTDKPDHRPIEEKESSKWLNGVNAVDIAFLELPDAERPQLVHIMDREGDIHEVLQLVTDLGQGAIIRAAQNRSVAGPIDKAYQAVAAASLLGRHDVDVPANHGQEKRRARLELRAATLTITPSCKRKNQQHRRPVTWTLIEAREINAPVGIEPLKWLLWTTEPADTLANVSEVLRLYKLRWRIEDFHLTLKSGCRTEALELETAIRLAKAITLYSAVAVRIVSMRDLARQEPDAPCTTILSDDAWKVLWIQFNKKTLTADVPVPTIKQAVLWIGRLGGHLNRKSDGMPGVRTLWRGWRDLILIVAGYRNALIQR